jgi:serine/threonine protein kinase
VSHAVERPAIDVPSGDPVLIAERYRVQSKLGGGGMAVVYEVVDSVSGRRVALKYPRANPNSTQHRKIQELFGREFPHALAHSQNSSVA